MHRFILLAILFISTSFGVALAAKEESAILTLDDALKIAYKQNPSMLQKRKEVEATKGARMTQSAFKGPEVSFEVGGFKSEIEDGEKVNPDKNLDSFEIIQPLDPPGVRFLRSQIAGNEVKIAEGDLLRTWSEVAKEVKIAFREVLYTEEAIKVFESNHQASRQFFDAIETKYQSGGAPRAERIRANIEFLRSQEELFEAQYEIIHAEARFNLLLGREPEAPISLSGSLADQKAHLSQSAISKEAVIKGALSNRSDLKNQRLRLDASKKERLKSKLSFLPEPFIGFSRTKEDYEDDYSVLVGVNLPLWDFNIGEMRQTNALAEKEKIILSALEREITWEARVAVFETELAEKKLDIAKKYTEEGNELLRQATLGYSEGELNFLGYLENLKTVKQTRLSYLTALKVYAEKIAELESATQTTLIPEEKH